MFAISAVVKRIAPVVVCLLLGWTGLRAATLLQLSLTDMIQQSTAIEHAKVLSSWAAFSGPVIYTHYKLQVTERLKGQVVTEIVVFGGTADGVRQVYPGTPLFDQGDDYVFFLWTNKAGMTHVVGLTQGMFHVAQDGSTDPGVTRAASHERMVDAKTGHAVKDQALAMKLSDLRVQIASVLAGSKAGQ